METTKWFNERQLRILDYQQKAIADVKQSMLDREITVLAASPSAGKTIMTIKVIEDYLKANPNHKVLILAHGTTVLRTQFHDVLEAIKPDFTYGMATGCGEFYHEYANKSVVVALPQTLARCKEMKFDIIFVDEAHEFYFAKTVQRIIKDSEAKKQVLLTGTPSEFILKGMHIIPIALNTVYDANMISDFYVHLASSSYNFDMKDFDTDGDLMNARNHFKKSETTKTLNALIKEIVTYLKSLKGNDYTNLMPEWLPTLKSLKKTMIACKSQHQAKQTQKYFESIGINSALSISDTDVDSLEIKRFVEDESILVLIVVGRGILGFNMPELVNIVDMTMSYNIDRIYQLLCRVARKHPDGDKKLFFKIAPQMLTDYYQHIMTAVCMLTEEEFFLKYNGKNFREMEIIIKKAKKPRKNTHTITEKKKKQKKYTPIDMGDLPVFEFFKSIYHKKGELLTVYAKTTINDVRAEFMDYKPKNYWNKENLTELALTYDNHGIFFNEQHGAYLASKKIGIHDEITAHMSRQPLWVKDKEACRIDALNYTSRLKWQRGSGSAYHAARKMGWLDELCGHMDSPINKYGYWNDKNNCREAALKCKTITEFKKRFSGASESSRKNGWWYELTAHMTRKRVMNDETLIAEILKYHDYKIFKKEANNLYQRASKRGILKTSTAHMINRTFYDK